MQKFLKVSAPLLLLGTSSNPSFGNGVVVTMETHRYEVRQDYTRRELNSLRGGDTLAYTRTNFGIELFYRLDRGAEAGHIVATLHANLTGGHQEIQIPSEYAPDTCEYSVLRDHELRHVHRNVEAMTWLRNEIEREESSKPVREFAGKSADEVLDLLQHELDSATTKFYLKKFIEVRRQLNEPLDSESARLEEYGQCHNWRTR